MDRKWERIHGLVVKMNNSSALKPFLEQKCNFPMILSISSIKKNQSEWFFLQDIGWFEMQDLKGGGGGESSTGVYIRWWYNISMGLYLSSRQLPMAISGIIIFPLTWERSAFIIESSYSVLYRENNLFSGVK